LGDNGAGKSALIKILGGGYRADAGRVPIGDVPYRHQPSQASGRQPVALIHQDLGLILVTADNIAFDGSPKNIFDPDNGYRDQRKKIWGAKQRSGARRRPKRRSPGA
jgi:ABC-type sugar transport system ATPase subunit